MAKNKISKEDLKSPDAFISFADKVGQALSDNWKPIAGLVGIVLVGLVGYAVSTAMNRSKEAAASEAIFEVEQKITEVRTEHAKKQQDSVKDLLEKEDKDGKNEEEITKRLEDFPDLNFEKDFAPIVGAVEQAITEHESTQTAQMARIRLARLYIDYEQLDRAEQVLRPALKNTDKDSSLYGLTRTLLASVLSHKGQIDESIQLLTQVLDDPSLSYMHSEVLLKLGVLNKEAGNTSGAEEMFRRVTTEFAETEAGKMAKNYLKMIRFITPKAKEESNEASAIDL